MQRPLSAVLAVMVLCGATSVAPGLASEAFASSSYSIRVVNSGAGGGGRVFHVGSPINITVLDRAGRSHKKISICLTPAPISKPSCHVAHLNRTLDSLAPSAAGRTKIRVKIGTTVLVREIRVVKAAS
jgi:hypothetical protein